MAATGLVVTTTEPAVTSAEAAVTAATGEAGETAAAVRATFVTFSAMAWPTEDRG